MNELKSIKEMLYKSVLKINGKARYNGYQMAVVIGRFHPYCIIIINISYFKCSSMNHRSRGSKETLALLELRTPALY